MVEEEISDEEGDVDECLNDSCLGGYVLYKFMDKKFYVGSALAESIVGVTVRLVRKYVMHGDKLTFVWPKKKILWL